jgi:hypothetical protein
MMFRIVFWDILPCKTIVDRRFTRLHIPEDNSEHQNCYRYLQLYPRKQGQKKLSKVLVLRLHDPNSKTRCILIPTLSTIL